MDDAAGNTSCMGETLLELPGPAFARGWTFDHRIRIEAAEVSS